MLKNISDASAFVKACGELRYWPRESMLKINPRHSSETPGGSGFESTGELGPLWRMSRSFCWACYAFDNQRGICCSRRSLVLTNRAWAAVLVVTQLTSKSTRGRCACNGFRTARGRNRATGKEIESLVVVVKDDSRAALG